ncbi:MAG: hypothetical protein ACSHXL_06315 [Bacteroidota bacterium]
MSNGLRIYKINSSDEFEELQILGTKVYHFTFKAEQYPEKLRIMDMLNLTEGYVLSDPSEWEQFSIQP